MSSNIRVKRICKNCGNEFEARKTTSKTCSDNCAKKLYKAKQKTAKIEAAQKETLDIKAKPIQDLKAKEFLSIADTCKVLGISRRSIYRLLERGEINAGKAGSRTIIKRVELDKLFNRSQPPLRQIEIKLEPVQFDVSESYTLTEVQSKYGISETALQQLIKRNSIPKIKKGWYAYVPKTIIDKLLTQPNTFG